MQLTIQIDGRPRQVQVERMDRDGAGPRAAVFRIDVDGRSHLVDAVALDRGALSLILVDGERRLSHQVLTAAGGAAGEVDVLVDGRAVTVALNARARRGPGGPGASAGTARVTAPMPGKVLRVLVGAGAPVEAGQALVVVEAMKMENELRSPRAGTVKQVEVQAGASVDAGRLLVVVE
jgi:biotin carboxyl carrier protein